MFSFRKAKVGVFIDAQNTFQECRDLYNHGSLHPLLLGDRLINEKEKLVMLHYHSGQHTSDEKEEEIKWNNKRNNFMKDTGVDLHIKNVLYAWRWMIEEKDKLPNPNTNKGRRRTAQIRSVKIAREKGIDTGLVLNAMVMLASRQIDKAIIISADRDIAEILEASQEFDKLIHNVRSFRENVSPNRHAEVIIASFAKHFEKKQKDDSHYLFLTKKDFDAVKDIIPYNKSGNEDINRKEAEFLKLHIDKIKYFPRAKRKAYRKAIKERKKNMD